MIEVKLTYHPDGKIKYKAYYENGKCHRPVEQGPAVIVYYDNGQILREEYLENGEKNRPVEQGPAAIAYYENGQISCEIYKNGQIHRPVEQGPASIWYYENGQIQHEVYYENGKWNRPVEQGPVFIWYHKNGQIEFELYYENDEIIYGTKLENLIQTRNQQHKAAKVLQKNWKIALWNMKYRDFMSQVLCVPANHVSPIGKLYPDGGHDYKKFQSLVNSF